MQVSSYQESKKHIKEHKIIPFSPANILRPYEAKRSVCARYWTLFATLLPVIQSLRQTGKYDSFPQTDSFGPFVSMNWFNSLVHLPEWLIHHRIIYATILAHFESEWLLGVWKWVLIEWIELVDLCYSSHELFQMFSPIWWTASTSSLKITSSKEWFLHELNITPDRLPEALDYSYIML